MGENSQKAILNWVVLGATVALILVIMLIIFGNLSGNLGFADGTAGYNNTEQVIGNYTVSAVNTAAQLPTVGTIVGIALLLLVLIALLVFAISKMMALSKGSSGSGASFG